MKALNFPIQIKRTAAQTTDDLKSSKIHYKLNISIDVTNVRLILEGSTTIYGELPISDFLAGEKNKTYS